MSLRIDTAELISGAYVIGETGLGVLGSAVPSTGEHGPSYLYNDLSLPADNGKEIRGLIVTPPVAGVFYAWEDGSFSLVSAPDGVYTFTYRLFVDGVDLGTAEATITIGGESSEASISLGGSRNRSSRGRFQDYDVPLPPKAIKSKIPSDKVIEPIAKVKADPKASMLAPKAKGREKSAIKAPRVMSLNDVLNAESMTTEEMIAAIKLLARIQIGPQLVRSTPRAKLIRA